MPRVRADGIAWPIGFARALKELTAERQTRTYAAHWIMVHSVPRQLRISDEQAQEAVRAAGYRLKRAGDRSRSVSVSLIYGWGEQKRLGKGATPAGAGRRPLPPQATGPGASSAISSWRQCSPAAGARTSSNRAGRSGRASWDAGTVCSSHPSRRSHRGFVSASPRPDGAADPHARFVPDAAVRRAACRAFGNTFAFHEEKQTDVGIAVKMVTDALVGKVDRLVLLTANSDQIPTAKFLRTVPNIALTLIYPPQRGLLARELGKQIPDRDELTDWTA